ncbi:hypothetical protein ACO03V_05915 [Microbacterium sp. HMH0099]
MPPYEPMIPDSQRLGASQAYDGALTAHVLDEDNKLRGRTTWPLVDDQPGKAHSSSRGGSSTRPLTSEEEEHIEEIAALVNTLIVAGSRSSSSQCSRAVSRSARPWLSTRRTGPSFETFTVRSGYIWFGNQGRGDGRNE